MRLLKLCVVCCAIALLLASCWRSGPSAPSQTASPPNVTPSPPVDSAASPSASPPSAGTPPPEPSAPPAATAEDEEADRIVASLTLEQKIGNAARRRARAKINDAARRMIADDQVGGIILFKKNLSGGLNAAVDFLNELKNADRRQPAAPVSQRRSGGGRAKGCRGFDSRCRQRRRRPNRMLLRLANANGRLIA